MQNFQPLYIDLVKMAIAEYYIFIHFFVITCASSEQVVKLTDENQSLQELVKMMKLKLEENSQTTENNPAKLPQ